MPHHNPWIDHVKAVYGRSNGKLTYKQAMVRASATWKQKRPKYRGSTNFLRVANDVRLAASRGSGYDGRLDFLLADMCKIKLTEDKVVLYFDDGSPSIDRGLGFGATAAKVRAFLEQHDQAHLLTAKGC